MSLLEKNIKTLENDLISDPVRISAYHVLPFAIFLYDPREEYICRKHIRLLGISLEQNHKKKVTVISLGKLLWKIIHETEGVDALIAEEKQYGFDRLQKTINQLMSDEDFMPLPNLLEDRIKAIALYWIVVTSQEKLNEVVDSLDSRKIELARLQDRFRITIDLKQSDISEITGKRVLEKNEQAKTMLETLYNNNEGRLKTFCTLERTSRDTSITKDSFMDLYPYLPYQIDPSIDIVSGLRLKRGAHRHIGGSNRTIIKQAQEMMINPRTMVAELPIGTLVTFDKIYELLYMGNLLPIETYREIDEFAKSNKDDEMVK
jgi:hypothetical protein